MSDTDAELLRLLLHQLEDLYRAIADLTVAVHGVTAQIAVRVISVEPDPPLPSIQQDER